MSRKMHIAPLPCWAIGTSLGIILDEFTPIYHGFAVAAVIFALAGGGLVLARRMPHPAVLAFILAASTAWGVALHHHARWMLPSRDIAAYVSPEPSLGRIRGRVVSTPRIVESGYEPFRPWIYQNDRTTFLLQAEAVETIDDWAPASGLLAISIKEAALNIEEGQSIEAYGWLYRGVPPSNPGEFDWALRHARHGLHARMTCDWRENITVYGGVSPTLLTRLRDRVRSTLHPGALAQGDEESTLLDALLLGRRGAVDPQVEELFLTTGCSHYLAVSGIHVAMVVGMVWYVLRVGGAGRRAIAAGVLLAIVAYALIVEPRPPIARAAVMGICLCAATLLNRQRCIWSALALAAVILLFVDPCSLFDPGFQLSFVAVGGIVAVTSLWTEDFPRAIRRIAAHLRKKPPDDPIDALAKRLTGPPPAWRRTIRRGARALGALAAVSFTAWLVTAPIALTHFGRLAPFGAFNSLVASPFVFVVMLLGVVQLAVGMGSPTLAGIIGWLTNHAVDLLLWVLRCLDDGTPAFALPPSPPTWLVLAFYAFVALAVVRRRATTRRWVTPLAGFALLTAAAWWSLTPPRPDGLRVTFLSVGSGTATVIEAPHGSVWLYDIGASGGYDPGRVHVLPYLRHRRIRAVDGVFLSHPDLDHFGGVLTVLDAVPCGGIGVSPQFEATAIPGTPGGALLRHLHERAGPLFLTFTAPSRIYLDVDVHADALWPSAESPRELSKNDSSLVLRVEYAGKSVLMPGDVDVVAQQWLLDHADLSADVLVLPHHGAIVETTQSFIDAVNPQMIVCSSARRLQTHPDLQPLVADYAFFNTADCGAVTLLIQANGEMKIAGFRDRAVAPSGAK